MTRPPLPLFLFGLKSEMFLSCSVFFSFFSNFHSMGLILNSFISSIERRTHHLLSRIRASMASALFSLLFGGNRELLVFSLSRLIKRRACLFSPSFSSRDVHMFFSALAYGGRALFFFQNQRRDGPPSRKSNFFHSSLCTCKERSTLHFSRSEITFFL